MIRVAEGVASDGGVYGRSLRIPDGGPEPGADAGGGVRRQPPSVLKSRPGDIPTCPCLAALVPDA
ncbi:hypothetical protein GCM10011578_022260 [Streptomyces fuscichromogenes]|uniref:Uncharacterized protein n=1 Tax=Streptomyces fuscichromogenes TaxID=1324013 RepID=A0A917XAA3_9ACTN|nr:hypothetical protein GCM10011578_022260 [Streptomyces fuscichromogenes]